MPGELPPGTLAPLFAKDTIDPLRFFQMFMAHFEKAFAPLPTPPAVAAPGSAVATKALGFELKRIGAISDRIMHAMHHNANARELHLPFIKLPLRSGKMPSKTFPKDHDEVLKMTDASGLTGLLKEYAPEGNWASDLPTAQIQFLEYIGAKVD